MILNIREFLWKVKKLLKKENRMFSTFYKQFIHGFELFFSVSFYLRIQT